MTIMMTIRTSMEDYVSSRMGTPEAQQVARRACVMLDMSREFAGCQRDGALRLGLLLIGVREKPRATIVGRRLAIHTFDSFAHGQVSVIKKDGVLIDSLDQLSVSDLAILTVRAWATQ